MHIKRKLKSLWECHSFDIHYRQKSGLIGIIRQIVASIFAKDSL